MQTVSEGYVIVRDPEVLGGTPVFRGTRVPFQALLDYLEVGQPLSEFLEDFPTVSHEAAVAALELEKLSSAVPPVSNYMSDSELATRNSGLASLASGVVGIIAFASLIAYLVTQSAEFARSSVMPPVGRFLLAVDFVGATIQVLLMLPLSFTLHKLRRDRTSQLSKFALVVGITGFIAVAIARLLPLLNPAVSDILFMAPMGLVGLWLVSVNWLRAGMSSRGLTVVGVIAGIGPTLVGLNFFFNGGMVVFTQGPFAYATDIRFHMGLALGGLPGFILFPVWAIWLGIRLLRSQYS